MAGLPGRRTALFRTFHLHSAARRAAPARRLHPAILQKTVLRGQDVGRQRGVALQSGGTHARRIRGHDHAPRHLRGGDSRQAEGERAGGEHAGHLHQRQRPSRGGRGRSGVFRPRRHIAGTDTGAVSAFRSSPTGPDTSRPAPRTTTCWPSTTSCPRSAT